MRILMAGSLDYFIACVKQFCQEGFRPDLLILPAEKDLSQVHSQLDPYEIETWVINDIHSLIEPLQKREPDLLICIGYPEILKPSLYEIPRLGTINLHTSKLPEYRGRHPVNWAMIEGAKEIGITVHFIDEGIDSGDILLQDSVVVEREDDLNSLHARLIPKGCALLLTAVRQLETGCAYHRKQDQRLASYLPQRTPADSQVDWNKTSWQLTQFINALIDPMPNAFTFSDGETIRFKRAYRGKSVGEVVAQTGDRRYIIATIDGLILVETEHKLEVGQLLGE